MLRIRPEQMKVFEDDVLRRFKNEMVEHSKDFSPQLCGILGEQQLHAVLNQAIQRASNYGFTNRGSVQLYIELVFLFGSDFDTDPQYSMLGRILNTADDQAQRAEQLYNEVIDYMDTVAGDNTVNVHSALNALADFARRPISFLANNFDTGIINEMTDAFPQKITYVGNEDLILLIHEARRTARTYRFTGIRANALLVVLMFAFGHGCTNDPLYPWISLTLNDEKIVNPTARAKRLEKKALTWLHTILARSQQEPQQ